VVRGPAHDAVSAPGSSGVVPDGESPPAAGASGGPLCQATRPCRPSRPPNGAAGHCASAARRVGPIATTPAAEGRVCRPARLGRSSVISRAAHGEGCCIRGDVERARRSPRLGNAELGARGTSAWSGEQPVAHHGGRSSPPHPPAPPQWSAPHVGAPRAPNRIEVRRAPPARPERADSPAGRCGLPWGHHLTAAPRPQNAYGRTHFYGLRWRAARPGVGDSHARGNARGNARPAAAPRSAGMPFGILVINRPPD
jgi:hypothetical protein